MDAISQRHQHSMNTTAAEESFYMSDAVVTVWQDHHLVSTVAVVYCKVLWCSWLNSYWHLNHSIAPSASAMDVTLQSHACLLQQRDWELRWVYSRHTWKASYRTFLRITYIHVTEHPALQPICVLGTRNAGVAGLMWFSAENCSFSLEGTLCRWTFRIGIYPSSMSFIVDNIRYSMPERIGFFFPNCWALVDLARNHNQQSTFSEVSPLGPPNFSETAMERRSRWQKRAEQLEQPEKIKQIKERRGSIKKSHRKSYTRHYLIL